MIKKVSIIFIFVLLVLQACGPRPETPDSSPIDEHVESRPDQRMERWLDYYGFDREDFTDSATYARPYRLEKRPFEINREDPFSALFVFNSDSTLAIDLDSYHLVLEEDSEGGLFFQGRGADMEIGLIDLKDNSRERLLFCGPACLFEEGSFHPDGHIVITGFSENGQGYSPTIWRIQPEKDSLEVFITPGAYDAAKITYLPDVRLKHIRFRHNDKPAVSVDL